jgi:Ca2+-binding RTX toxin-like protein
MSEGSPSDRISIPDPQATNDVAEAETLSRRGLPLEVDRETDDGHRPADGNFLGNVHQGTGVNPDAPGQTTAEGAGGSGAEVGGVPASEAVRGIPLKLPLIPEIPAMDISVEIVGLPESAALSSGRSQAGGRWAVAQSEVPDLHIVAADGSPGSGLTGPSSLQATFVVTDPATGAVGRTSTIVTVTPDLTFSISSIADSDAVADSLSESASDGAAVGITAFASDADPTDTVAYSLTDSAGGRFVIDPLTGVVMVADASLLDYETATSHTITVQATSTDGTTSTRSFTIELSDDTSESAVSPVSDTDAAPNAVSESAANGNVVGVAAFAADADATDTVSYSLTDDAGGRFAIDPTTGVVTVVDASLLDYETATSHTISVQATSTDGSTSTRSFTIGLGDDNTEYSVSATSDVDAAANTVSESATNSAIVGVTAIATDADPTDIVTYSLTDDAGGRFAIDPATGVVTVADASLLDYETSTSHTISVQATSSDGSTSTMDFAVAVGDNTKEFAVTAISDIDAAANRVSESAANGAVVGITAFASDADGSDTVTYNLNNDAGGRFAIDPVTGVVTVADASLLDYETATKHTVQVRATSSDGSTKLKSFTINLTDDKTEFLVSAIADTNAAADTVSENAAKGTVVGITAFANDGDRSDTVRYSLTDNAGGRFAINSKTGVVTVNKPVLLDYETAQSHTITVQAKSSDGSTSTQSFTIALGDDTVEFSVTPVSDTDAAANAVSESAANGAVVGITAFASDADGSDSVTYSLADDAGGRFAIDATTGVVTVADASLLDYETAQGHTITVQATSTDGSTSVQSFSVSVGDETSEFAVTAVSDSNAAANTVSESAANGTVVGITAFASDGDTSNSVTYSLADDAGGRFAIDATTGVVTVADASLLDYETARSHTVTVRATSTDGSTATQSFSIGVTDANDAPTGMTFTNGDTYSDVVQSHSPVAYWRLADSAGSGVATDAMGAHDGSYAQGAYSQNAAGPFSGISNSAAIFDGVNDYVVVPSSTDFVLPEGTIQAWFKVDAFNGRDHTIVSMDSSGTDTGSAYLAVDGARQDVEFYIEDNAAPVTFGDTGNHYMLSGNNSVIAGQWHHVAITFGSLGMVMYLDGVQVATNAYTGGIGNGDNEPITIGASQRYAGTEGQAISGELDRFFDGQIAEVALYDRALSATDFAVLADAGINGFDIPGNAVVENAADGTAIGQVEAADPDSGETFTYALLDDAGGRFAINASTGLVAVANGALLDYETAAQHSITVQVSDSGGASYSKAFTINVANVNELSGSGFHIGSDAADIVSGTDLSEGQGGEEIMLGLSGDDTLRGDGNEDRLIGGDGNDMLFGGDGADIMEGGVGNDVADGGAGDDVYVFRMGDGNDTLSGGSGSDVILLMGADGGSPNLSDWNLTLTGGTATWASDHVTLSSGATGTIAFVDGSSVAFDGTERIDFSGGYSIDSGNSIVTIADAGGDTVSGSTKEDTIFGGAGDDTLLGGNDEDLLLGGGGDDTLYGGNQDDVLFGGDGDDTLYGNQGNDVLVGGLGDDMAEGGQGDDTFVFASGWGSDTFVGGGGWTDMIQLSGLDSQAAYSGWTLTGATVTESGDDYLVLSGDSDGTITFDDGSQLAFADVERIEW